MPFVKFFVTVKRVEKLKSILESSLEMKNIIESTGISEEYTY